MFKNDIKASVVLTKEETIDSVDQLMDRDVTIFMYKNGYEYKIMKNLRKLFFLICL